MEEVDNIKNQLYELNQNRQVIVHWVTGHCGIKINEIVDRLAKKATSNDRSVLYHLTREEMFAYLDVQFRKYWDECWKSTVNATGKRAHLIHIRDNVNQCIPVYKLKCRKYEKIIHRLRLGHVGLGLKKYLYKIDIVESPLCTHCNVGSVESIEHYILDCPAYINQ